MYIHRALANKKKEDFFLIIEINQLNQSYEKLC